MKRFKSAISICFLLLYITFIAGCSYYKVKQVKSLNSESISKEIKQKKKYIIVHHGEIAWHLKDIVVNETNQELTGTPESLPDNHLYYKSAKGKGQANRYKNNIKEPDRPIFEVHIYTTLKFEKGEPQFTIPFSSISKIEVYDTDVGTTVISIIGVTLLVSALLAVIVAATKSSCPFVYIGDGYSYNFTGEMYGGAIFSSLERDDYMPLPGFFMVNDEYHLKISNELLERQYTNLANLLVVEHPKNSSILLDKKGEIQTITLPEVPTKATANTDIDITNLILQKDSSAYLFNEHVEDGKDISSLILSFKKPLHSTTGKLILNAKNSFWLDYVYGKFNEQFGIFYNTFAEKQKKVPAEKHNQWSLEQNIPLSVYVETESGWKIIDYFNSIGPLASRDIVMPIDLTKIKGENVRIKLECGFMFWEVDYAAIDFSPNIPVDITRITASSAVDEKGNDVSSSIVKTDNEYLIQPEIGNAAIIKYKGIPVKAESNQTVFLHTSGYYEYIRDYKNWPNISYLESFKNKGAFTNFAKQQYDQFMSTQNLLTASLTQSNGN